MYRLLAFAKHGGRSGIPSQARAEAALDETACPGDHSRSDAREEERT
ncbi:hypothetical protein [Actinomadura rupiterrae]|nr:hypothetical protein [Actinomadura rupiterrae]MCP2341667.1 hypothetical protein [Actinomadura rupiterrae]